MTPERFPLRRPLRALPLPLLLLAACGRAAPDEQAAVNTKGEGDPKGQAVRRDDTPPLLSLYLPIPLGVPGVGD